MTRKSDEAGRSTIRDVAARAGVSASTVSRVLAGDYPVSAATRTRVLRAVRELDYVADARAKAVAGAGTPTLAFVLEDITGPSFAHMAHGVEREAARLGHLSLVCSTDGDVRRELEFIEMMRAQRAAAVILVGGAADTPEYRERTRRIADSLASAGSRLHQSVGGPRRTPAGAQHQVATGSEGVGHETARGTGRRAGVHPGQGRARHIQVARHPGRDRPEPGVEDVGARGAGQRDGGRRRLTVRPLRRGYDGGVPHVHGAAAAQHGHHPDEQFGDGCGRVQTHRAVGRSRRRGGRLTIDHPAEQGPVIQHFAHQGAVRCLHGE
ncbi:LacI family DNA-binding transcriptional regulator, partial [Streptomyces sp. NPDC005921]